MKIRLSIVLLGALLPLVGRAAETPAIAVFIESAGFKASDTHQSALIVVRSI
jgi:hypothetical protein